VSEDLSAVTEAITVAREVLAPTPAISRGKIDSPARAAEALRTVRGRLEDRLSAVANGRGEPVPADGLVSLLHALHRAEQVVSEAETGLLTRRVAAVQDALTRLDGVDSVEQLWRACARAICDLGFDRGMFSLVDKAIWVPQAGHSQRELAWTQHLVEAGRRSPRNIDPQLPEFDLVRRRKAILVTDVQRNPNVYQEVVAASRSQSYVAARIVANGEIVGFVHADRYFQREAVDELDRTLLGVFGEAFGHVLSRAMLLERSAAIQDHLASLAAGITDAAADLRWSRGDLDRPVVGAQGVRNTGCGGAEPRLVDCGLTSRETQILRLMASGADNAEIARRLFIANETVKSHVKHVLRKLGAGSRAEAVARWFNDPSGRPAP
jgi:DNA-binding CsgD family transcriptional regulator